LPRWPGVPKLNRVERARDTLRTTGGPVGPRALNVLLGVWLFASAFLWRHPDNVGYNDWVCGLLVAAAALSAVWAPGYRFVSAGIAVWLSFSTLLFGYQSFVARLHDLALAGAIFVVSLVHRPPPLEAREGEG